MADEDSDAGLVEVGYRLGRFDLRPRALFEVAKRGRGGAAGFGDTVRDVLRSPGATGQVDPRP